jgi:hypothetical protein
MKKFFATKDSSRSPIPAAKRYVGVEGDEEFYAQYMNTLAYELNQVDYIIGTAADVTNGAANVKIITGGVFKDIDDVTVTFVQGDRIAIIGHDALDANLSFTANDLVFEMNPDVSIDLGSAYTLTISGTGARGNLNFTNAIDKSIIVSDPTSFLEISTANASSVKAVGSGMINGNLHDSDALITDNLIQNSFKAYWQGGTSVAGIASGATIATTWQYYKAGTNVANIAHDMSRQTGVPTTSEAGVKSNYAARLTFSGAGQASLAVDDICTISTFVPGYKFIQIDQQTATFSIWVKAATTGTYCLSYRNSGKDRSYVAEFTIDSASTWERKEITIDFDYSGGTWDYEFGNGIEVSICLGAGTNFQTTKDTWATGNYVATSSQVNALVAGSGTFDWTLDQLNEGSTAKDLKAGEVLEPQYDGLGVDFTLTGSVGWATSKAWAIPYKTENGEWYIKGAFRGTATAIGLLVVTFSGVVFHPDMDQPVTSVLKLSSATKAVYISNTTKNTTNMKFATITVSVDEVECTFDVRITSKPTWV